MTDTPTTDTTQAPAFDPERRATELAIHVVGNDKPSLLYNMQILYMPKRSA